jgi:hypothetical protein
MLITLQPLHNYTCMPTSRTGTEKAAEAAAIF